MTGVQQVMVPPGSGGQIATPMVEVAPGVLAETARRFVANRLAVAGLIVVTFLVGAAVLADVLSPYPRDFATFSQVLKHPTAEHLLGTDAVGRDFLTRVLHAARTSMLVGLLVPILAAVVGIPLGALAAWRGGRPGALFMRFVEIFTAVPPYMLVILLVSIWGSGVDKLILFLGATGWVGLARLARAQVVQIRPLEYVTSAHALGASD